MEVNKEKVKVVHPFVCNDAVKLLRTVLDDFNFLLKHIKTNFNKVGFEANVFITPFLFEQLGAHCGYSDLIFDLYRTLSSFCVSVYLKEYYILNSCLFCRDGQDQKLIYYFTVKDRETDMEYEFNVFVKDWYKEHSDD